MQHENITFKIFIFNATSASQDTFMAKTIKKLCKLMGYIITQVFFTLTYDKYSKKEFF